MLKIIGIIIGIFVFAITAFIMGIQFWAEGQVIDAIMSAFGFNPIIAGLIAVLGSIALIFAIIKLASSTFG